MGSEDELHLPKIIFSGLNPMITGDDKWAEIRALVWSAVEAHGCFEAEYDKVTPKLRDALFGKCMKELFELPSEIKMKNTSNKPYHGYIGNIPCRAYESLNVDNANESEGVEEFSALMWGDKANPSFCNTIFTFSKHIAELEQMVRRMILESLGMAKYYDECIKSTAYGLRLSEYGIGSTNNIGMQSHRDSIILAIVCQHGVEGLEVQAKHGRWLTPSLNSLTVIIGEAFWAWTNGRIEPPFHRVFTAGERTRYSAVFSSRPRDGILVESPAELIDDEHPLQFKPYEYGDYVRFSYSETGFNSKCALRDYCGVSSKDEEERDS